MHRLRKRRGPDSDDSDDSAASPSKKAAHQCAASDAEDSGAEEQKDDRWLPRVSMDRSLGQMATMENTESATEGPELASAEEPQLQVCNMY